MGNFSKSKIFLLGILFFIAGIGIASFLPAGWKNFEIYLFAAFLGFAVVFIFGKKKNFLVLLFLALLFFGMWRYFFSLPGDSIDKIWHYNGEKITFIGKIMGEPDVRKNSSRLIIKAEKLKGSNPVLGKVLVVANLFPSYNYGSKLEITCKIENPERFKDFAYDRYLARYDVYSICYYPEIKLLNKNGGNFILKKIYAFKNKLREIIEFGLAEPESGLARALVLGDKKIIEGNVRDSFSKSGLSHIAAISGMHIGIISLILMWLLLRLGFWRKQAFYFASVFLIFYIILIGAPASAIRAGIMGFLLLLSFSLGRLNNINNSLVLAGALMLLINPKILRDDIGFQLSFLAVLGIVNFYPLLSDRSKRIKFFKFFPGFALDIFFVTLSAQILILPIIAYNFKQISLISLFSNLAVIWILPFVLVSIFGAIILSAVFINFAPIFFLPSFFILKYLIFIADKGSKIPLAYLEVDKIWWGWFLIYYFLILFFWEKYINKAKLFLQV